jgi:ribosomal protein S18
MPIDLLAQYDEPKDLLAEYDEKPSATSGKGFLGNYADYAKGAGLGIGQGLGDVLASMANYPGDIYSHFSGKESPYHVPHPALQKYYPEGIWGNIGSTLGNFEGQVIAPGGVAFKALKAVNNPLAKALMGAGAGGLVGAASNEGDRIGSGITGAALGTGGALASSIFGGLRGISSKGIATKLSADKLASKQLAKKEYGKLFEDASKRGLGKIKVPKIDDKRIVENSMPRYHEALLDFKNNPTVESAHWAQSDLGALRRHLEKIDASRGLTSTEHKTLKEVISSQDKIKKSMFSGKLEEHPDLANRYSKLSQKYKETVIPYENIRNLRKFEEGKLLPKDLVNLLRNDKEFRATLGSKYPQIKINQLLKGKVGKTIGTGILGAIGFEGGKKLIE